MTNRRQGAKQARRRQFLTPFQAAMLHLLLICIVSTSLAFHGNSCFILGATHDETCSVLQQFLLRDVAQRFVLWYSTALVAVITIRSMTSGGNLCLRRLNRALIVITSLNFLALVALYHYARFMTLEWNYLVASVLTLVLAIGISFHVCQPITIPTSKAPAKWSMPGTALFAGLSMNCIVVFASIQVLKSPEGLAPYLAISDDARNADSVTATFAMATLQSLLSVIILKSLRDSMSLQQLRIMCLTKCIASAVVLLLFELPEQSPLVQIEYERSLLGARIGLILLYLSGYLFAGTADNIGRILSGEKQS